MNPVDEFEQMLAGLTGAIAGLPLDAALEAKLNREFPAGGAFFARIRKACEDGVSAGWMCAQGEGRRRFGRIIAPGPATSGFSVDVVDIEELVGPHHRHPTGEIDMIMPVAGDARFDGRAEGWLVYGPDTAHRPTVSGGRARILYLLPAGEIEFTGS
ncbi:MAG: DUF4863 domain-containing protein [Rhodocyclales bacterium CG17_big_fil_post_rev_8_21_14_2_50_68_7]|nr:MAG: DUF4863 domain-containing protein [Rhodocyclales bacterium CG17_big_fil_post_rev_8_21_14_2_50_68_7]